jgi:hypothetical protein
VFGGRRRRWQVTVGRPRCRRSRAGAARPRRCALLAGRRGAVSERRRGVGGGEERAREQLSRSDGGAGDLTVRMHSYTHTCLTVGPST